MTPVKFDPSPAKEVAVRTPVLELNVKLDPLLSGKSPVAAVANKGKQVVSVDSSATVTFVEVVAAETVPEIFEAAIAAEPLISALTITESFIN